MRRDMELVRQLMLNLEPLDAHYGKTVSLSIGQGPLQSHDFTTDQIDYHLRIMTEGGLINHFGIEGGSIKKFAGLSWSGHEFVDAVREPETWKKLKNRANSIGTGGMGVVMELLKAYVKSEISRHTGLPF